MKNKIQFFLGLCFILALTNYINAQKATIDLAVLKQQITGFGGAHYPEWGTGLTVDQADKAFGNNPGQIGLQILRLPVPTDTTTFSMQIPAAAKAKENGAILFATPWSPPVSMKTNQNIIKGKLDTAYYDDFSIYLDSFANYMAANSASLYAISIQNEPDYMPTYASCRYFAQDFIDFLSKYGPNITSTKIMAPESFQFRHVLSDSILNDSAAASQVDIIGGHIYGGGLADYPLARDKGKEVWMTEHYIDGTNWAGDIATAKEINDCMLANYNAYVYWTLRHETGFISESGDILKRGYVMSQFSKFIRPGYTRVNAVTSSVSNVDLTAYKKDTDIVMVAINRNTTATTLKILLQNGSADTLTKFVTSASKNLSNEGFVVISGDSCMITLDAQSITTLTTVTDNGGRINNVVPVANAGIDQTYTDNDNNGYEPITLDGSASSDADGQVTIYTWSEAKKQIASGKQPTFNLGTGIHNILLTITDSDGALAKDSVIITVNMPSGSTEAHMWFEAECAAVGSMWNKTSNKAASNGMFIVSNNSTSSASEDSKDQVLFTFDVADSGKYKVWVRCRVPSADDDSYWVKMDTGTWTMWNNISGGKTFMWDYVRNSTDNSYTLAPGSHKLTFAYRENGAEMDKIYITNTGTVPTEMGDSARTCTFVDTKETTSEVNEIKIYPNPVRNQTVIEFTLDQYENVNLSVFDYTGRIVSTLYSGTANAGKNTIAFNCNNLENGVYFCKLNAGNKSLTKQIMVIK